MQRKFVRVKIFPLSICVRSIQTLFSYVPVYFRHKKQALWCLVFGLTNFLVHCPLRNCKIRAPYNSGGYFVFWSMSKYVFFVLSRVQISWRQIQ